MGKSLGFQSALCNDLTATILAGETISSAVSLSGTSLAGIDIPAGFEGTSLTFLVSSDGVTYREYKRMSDGALVTAVVGSNAAYASNYTDFVAYNFIKLVVDAQVADIKITLQTRPL